MNNSCWTFLDFEGWGSGWGKRSVAGRFDLGARVAGGDVAFGHDHRVDATMSLDWIGVRKAASIHAEAIRELWAAVVRLVRHFQHGGTDGEAGTGWNVVRADIEVHQDLITGNLPAITIAVRKHVEHRSVHHTDLGFGVCLAVRGPLVSSRNVVITDRWRLGNRCI